MSTTLDGAKVAVLVANEGVEQIELTRPWAEIESAGGQPVLIAPEAGEVEGFDHLDRADTFTATVASADAAAEDYAGLVLPGGVANPDQLRTDAPAVAFIRSVVASGRPVGVICHGPWSLIEADVVRGRRMTSWPSVRTDLENAGAEWVDQEVVVDTSGPGPLISSRRPDDLDAFCAAVVDALGHR